MRLCALFAALLLFPRASPAQLLSGTKYDPAIPTLKSVVGHDPGQEISTPDQIGRYLEALAKAAPDRTRLVHYATTWEGRPLHYLVVGSRERIARLDDIRRGMQVLGAGAADADRLVGELPVIIWFIHGVHGNEISSGEAALQEAYHLLAARESADVDLTLRETLVIIDPMQNPDGRHRFLAHNQLGRAVDPDPEPASAEHDEPWPGGRSNHYLFDMNRDYFSMSQPETRGRIKVMLEWFPQVVVDLHEMGGNSTYYFAPPADPINPQITEAQRRWLTEFGKENAAEFDRRGFGYFVREVYDSFYPGYGESWPIFHGAIGMTYEQASARGLSFRRQDGTLLTYKDAVMHHFTAAVTTAATAARNRERLLRDFLEYRRSATKLGQQGTREYQIPPGSDPSRVERLARLLVAQGIQVKRADEQFQAGSRQLARGTMIVPLAQPAGRLVRNLFDPETRMDDAFLKEQDRRRRERLPDQIYDVTAWSLPLAFDVEVIPSDRVATVRATDVTETAPELTGPSAAPPAIGFLMPWGVAAAATTVEALREGVRIQSADEAFTHGGRQYPDWHRVRAFCRSTGRGHGQAAGHRSASGRRAGLHSGDVDRRRHFSGKRPGQPAARPPRADGMGLADVELVRRMGAVCAGTPIWPTCDRDPCRHASEFRHAELRRARAAIRHLHLQRGRGAAIEGLDSNWRYARDDCRCLTVGGPRSRRIALHRHTAARRLTRTRNRRTEHDRHRHRARSRMPPNRSSTTRPSSPSRNVRRISPVPCCA